MEEDGEGRNPQRSAGQSRCEASFRRRIPLLLAVRDNVRRYTDLACYVTVTVATVVMLIVVFRTGFA